MYTQFYGFSKKPFNLTPDPDFLFVTESHQEALASLIYGIQERKGFISMTGEVGTGKTTLLRYLQTVLDAKIKTVLIVQTYISFIQLLKEILTGLKLTVGSETKFSMTQQLNEYLKQTLDRGENLVVLIDEAQNLSNEILEDLRMLSNLETSEAKLMQIVLVGQPELETKLNSEDLRQFKQRIGIRKKIQPVSEGESREYIEHRLSRVGSHAAAVFTPEALSLMCKNSGGIFRIINILCDNALLVGYSLQKKMIDADIIREVLNDLGIPIAPKSDRRRIVSRPKPVLHGSFGEPSSADGVELTLERRPHSFARTASYITAGIIGLGLVFFLGWEYFKGAPQSPVLNPALQSGVVAEKVAPPISGMNAEAPRKAFVRPPATESIALAPAIREGKASAQVQGKKKAAFEPPPATRISADLRGSSNPENQFNKVIGVAQGGTLSSIVLKYYKQVNLTLVDHILEFNPKIENIHVIQVNQKIKIPEIREDSLLRASRDGGYQVHLGTFDNPKAVERYQEEPILTGKKIEAIPRQVAPEETWYRVVAGKFETREGGLKAIQELKKKGMLPALQGRN